MCHSNSLQQQKTQTPDPQPVMAPVQEQEEAVVHAPVQTTQQMQVQVPHAAVTEQETPVQREQVIARRDNVFVERKTDKHGKVTEKIGRLRGKKIRTHHCEVRQDGLQQALDEHARFDAATKTSSKAYSSAMASVQAYTRLKADETNPWVQGEAMTLARTKLLDAKKQLEDLGDTGKEEEKQKRRKELETIQRYLLHFEIIADGNLPKRQELERDPSVEGTWMIDGREGIKLHNPSWIDSIRWKKRDDVPLFPHEPGLKDIKQGRLGDCYLQAALAEQIMLDPVSIKNSMRDNGDHTVTVRFYKNYTSEEEWPQDIRDAIAEKPMTQMNDSQKLVQVMKTLASAESLYSEIFERMKRSEEYKEAIRLCKQDMADCAVRMTTETARETKSEEEEQEKKRNLDQIQEELRRIAERQNDLTGEYERRAEQVLKTLTRLFRMDGTFASHAGEAVSYAAEMAEDARLQPLLTKLREIIGRGGADVGKTKLDTADLAELAIHCSGQITEETMRALETDHQEAKDALHGEVKKHPVYVTVTKDIPSTLMGDTVYTHGPLWVQMIEKAYVASGLHPTEAKEKLHRQKVKAAIKADKKCAGWTETQKMEEEEARMQAYRRQREKTYKSISGGRSHEFMEIFTGQKGNVRTNTPITAVESSRKNLREMLIAKTADEMGNRLATADAAEVLEIGMEAQCLRVVFEYMEKRLGTRTSKYKVKKGAEKGQEKEYVTDPLTIEDVCEEIARIGDETNADYKAFVKAIEQENPLIAGDQKQRKAFIDQLLRTAVVKCEQYLDAIPVGDAFQSVIQHRIFATKTNDDGQEEAKYTDYAKEMYRRIQAALEHHQMVCASTHVFKPREVSSSGLNGESLGGGLAERHAYSVLGTQEIRGHKFVLVRNPWSHMIRGYKKVITPASGDREAKVEYIVKEVDKKKNEQEGQFLMELNDFISRTDQLFGIE